MLIGKGAVGQGMDYNVDIALCIDATGSMGRVIDNVKSSALSFYSMFVDAMEREGKSVQQLRIKVIAFRDYGADSEPMKESEFFVLGGADNDQSEDFHNFVKDIEAEGGGDAPENSLEALALAMNSDWTKEGSVRRHVIIMYTDAPALPLGDKSEEAGYPAGMPADFAELPEWWEGQKMEKRAKRLQIFAPDIEPWTNMVDWSNTFHMATKDFNVDVADLETCIHLLVKSI